MIDTHAHIDTDIFDEDRQAVIERALNAGVEIIIIPSIGIEGFDKLQALVESHPNIYRGIGIHPHNVATITDNDIRRVEQESSNKNVVAIGEIGLDYYYDFAPKDVQQLRFRQQLQIAKNVGLPVIIHNRESDEDVLRIVGEEQDGTLQGVFHCFSGDVDMMNKCMDVGFHISFTGNITFKKSTMDDVVKNVPQDKFMIETDSPYITPVPFRGKRNEPSYVRYVAEKIAQIRNMTTDEIITMTTNTAKKLFALALLTVLFVTAGFAQDDYDDHPYPKKLGIMFIGATNTIVEAQTFLEGKSKDGTQPISYNGVFSWGVALNYAVSDKFVFETSYIKMVNTKVTEPTQDNPFPQPNPNTHQTVEVVAKYLFNPYSKVVFYPTIGGVVFFNDYNVGDKPLIPGQISRTTTVPGVAVGFGLFMNINTPIGLLTPGAEWRIDFFLNTEDKLVYNAKNGALTNANVSTFFSLPRASITWYPKF